MWHVRINLYNVPNEEIILQVGKTVVGSEASVTIVYFHNAFSAQVMHSKWMPTSLAIAKVARSEIQILGGVSANFTDTFITVVEDQAYRSRRDPSRRNRWRRWNERTWYDGWDENMGLANSAKGLEISEEL